MTEKFATTQGTQSYFKNHSLTPSCERRFDNLTISSLGLGTYLGESTDVVDRILENAIVTAVTQGINFIDTAVNYRCQRSERALAYALRKLSTLGVTRDQIVIATKGGFLPANESAEGFQDYILQHFIKTAIMKTEDIIANCHCMTPKYMQSQINMSLSNMRLDTIDLYYLHNPEIQLKHIDENDFYKKLTTVFEVFEQNIADGKIKRYGIATWDGFRQSKQHKELLNLNKIVACAKNAGGSQHHFKAIQVPYNLALMDAVAIRNQSIQSEDYPVIPAAVYNGIDVMISAPLMQGRLNTLPARFLERMPGNGTAIQKALQFVTSSPGVISAMVGMKSPQHLTENLKVLHMEKWEVTDLQNIAELLVKSVNV